jgi:hypothetical protein
LFCVLRQAYYNSIFLCFFHWSATSVSTHIFWQSLVRLSLAATLVYCTYLCLQAEVVQIGGYIRLGSHPFAVWNLLNVFNSWWRSEDVTCASQINVGSPKKSISWASAELWMLEATSLRIFWKSQHLKPYELQVFQKFAAHDKLFILLTCQWLNVNLRVTGQEEEAQLLNFSFS